MKRRTLIVSHTLAALGAAALFTLMGAGSPAPAPSPQPENMDPAKMQEAMAAYMKSIKPSDKHKLLERFVGDWEVTTRMFMDPAAPPIETKGAAKCELIHGGRFVQMESTGTFKLPGMDGKMTEVPMNGLGMFGYDNNRKLYTMVWTNTLSTAMLTASGGLSQDGKAMTLFGEMDEPLTGEVGKAVKYAIKFADADHFVLEISEVIYGEPFRAVEVAHVRKGKAAAPVEK